MSEIRVKKRETGATATLGRNGHPQIATPTGGQLAVVTAASDPGFNPLDLLYSSLAACLVLSARIAASRLGVLDRFESVEARVTGEKSEGEPARITHFDMRLKITGDFDAETKQAIAHMAEDICTVSNTLRGDAAFNLSVE
ncbi:peroxiredoxin, Ohr subfamily [Agrobacterium sp. DSM 25558]|uniref:OsmC family protein n=1 Tax=Agrobacterium sp. DSM 25558 TaxID=1907665 RepID=UPI0009726484|nr:OsmC family protein [Agrobacterium sp. DSM 25558]SCX00090.1 peroxiredoxin, Ohr subfamily [Agrobacterium sp. DSM 25558]